MRNRLPHHVPEQVRLGRTETGTRELTWGSSRQGPEEDPGAGWSGLPPSWSQLFLNQEGLSQSIRRLLELLCESFVIWHRTAVHLVQPGKQVEAGWNACLPGLRQWLSHGLGYTPGVQSQSPQAGYIFIRQ